MDRLNENQVFHKIKNAGIAIFDLDGTLIDSVYQILVALNLARVECDLESATFELIKKNIGLPFAKLNSDLDLDLNKLQKLKNLFRERLHELILEDNLIYPGVLELLPIIKNSGTKIAVATSKPQILADAVIQNSDLRKYVDFIQGTDDFEPKPNPEVIYRILSRFDSDSAFIVGDRTEDILAGLTANILTVGIAQSGHSIKDLNSSGANLAFNDFKEFFETWVS
jgi:phosphoglycolate phosphatase